MPIIERSSFDVPFLLANGHLQTVWPSLTRKVEGIRYERRRIATPDGDFLDLDFHRIGTRRAVVVIHGLEGSARQPYVKGMIRAFAGHGWDGVGMNCRGCGGEPNLLPRAYHAGASDDLRTVVDHLLACGDYDELALVGFSLGGCIVLKYLGEEDTPPPAVRGGAAISAPCHLASASPVLSRGFNRLYLRRFLRSLKRKVRLKAAILAPLIDLQRVEAARDFRDFDAGFTAPLHGFASAEDYWERCRSARFIPRITVPTLILNAADDPFLSPDCFPTAEARESAHVYLEVPRSGGHVGFFSPRRSENYWHETRVTAFIESIESALTAPDGGATV